MTSFWRDYVKITSFWRYNDVIITPCVQWERTQGSGTTLYYLGATRTIQLNTTSP